MKINTQVLVKSIVMVAILSVALLLIKIWLPDLLPEILFWKLLGTLLILGVLVSFIIAVKQDLSDEKKLRDDKFID